MTNRITFSIRRHAIPKKDSRTGASLDELADEGVKQAQEVGAQLIIPNGGIAVYHSQKYRAKQTVELILGSQTPLLQEEAEQLNAIAWSNETKEEILMKGEEQRPYAEVIDYLIEHQSRLSPVDCFSNAGHAILTHLKDAYGVVKGMQAQGDEALVENITHGPCIEAALMQLLNVNSRNTVKAVSEIGGPFNPAENFTVVVEYNNTTGGVLQANVQYRNDKCALGPEAKALVFEK